MEILTKTEQMAVYRDFWGNSLLERLERVMASYSLQASGGQNVKSLVGAYCQCMHELIELAGNHGFRGNLWQDYLTYLLVNNENAFSTACEIRGAVEGSINELAMRDFALFMELYHFDFEALEDARSPVVRFDFRLQKCQ